jgi:hypothetical protein
MQEEQWTGRETDTPYGFLNTVAGETIMLDLQDAFFAEIGDGLYQSIIFDFLFDRRHTCFLSVMRSLSENHPEISYIYWRYVHKLQQGFAREETISVIKEMSAAAAVEILLYVPERKCWLEFAPTNAVAKYRLIMTNNSIMAGWVPQESEGPFGEIHISSQQESHLAVACSIISEMYQVKIFRKEGKYKIEDAKNRTTSEAAQRVLLHALKGYNLTCMFPYKIDKKKPFLTHIERYERALNSLSELTGIRIPIITGVRPESAVSLTKKEGTSEEKQAEIQVLKEEMENKMMAEEEQYTRKMERFKLNQREVTVVRRHECMREIKIRNKINYKHRLEQAKKNFVDPAKLEARGLELQKEKALHHDRVCRVMIREVEQELKALEPDVKNRAYFFNRARVDPRCLATHEKCNELGAEVKRLFSICDNYDPMKQPETVYSVKLELINEMRDDRNASPIESITILKNEEYEAREEQLRQFRENRARKTREEALEMKKCIDYLKEADPVSLVTREKPHRVAIILPKPTVPNYSHAIEEFEKKKTRVELKPDFKVVKKISTPRLENRFRLTNETAQLLPSKTVIPILPSMKLRLKLLKKAQKLRDIKDFKPVKKQWVDMKSDHRNLREVVTDLLDPKDPLSDKLNRIMAGAAVRMMLNSAQRGLDHSGKRPSLESLSYTNEESLALLSLISDAKKRRYLRMFLPNNISSKICAHNAVLIKQRFQL